MTEEVSEEESSSETRAVYSNVDDVRYSLIKFLYDFLRYLILFASFSIWNIVAPVFAGK